MSRPLVGWLVADAISLTGTRVSMIAIPWFVLTTTGSATQTGLVAFAELAPLVLAKVLGGPVIDRLGARRVSIACDLLSAGVVALIPLLHALGLLTFPLLLGVVAVAGGLRGPGEAARDALTPAIVEAAGVPMERATGLASTVERTASMLGAAAAGALVALVGPATALLVDAVSFALAAAVLGWATVGVRRPAAPDSPTRAGYWRSLGEGWAFLRREPVVLGLSIMVAVTNLLDLAFSVVLVPVWASETGRGAAAIGLYFAVWSGASAVGSLVAAAWGERIPRFRIYLAAFLLTGLTRYPVLALDSPLWLLLGATVVGGLASGFLNPILGAVFFERTPAPLLGRVSSLSSAMAWGLMPLGGLVGGLLVGGLGLSAAMLACGAAYLLATLAPAAVPAFRTMDRRPRPEMSDLSEVGRSVTG